MTTWQRWRQWAANLKAQTYALYLAYRDPRTPWYAKALALAVVGYAFSPIDLIPDFIPLLGYLDDLVLLPLGVALVLKLVPPQVMAECRLRAEAGLQPGRPASRWAAAIIVGIWVVAIGLAVVLVARLV